MDDKTIIDLLWSRSEMGIEQIKNKYGRLCGAIIFNILPDMRDVEECIADTYIRIWNTIPPELPRSLQEYLARIARNVALDRYAYNHAAVEKSYGLMLFRGCYIALQWMLMPAKNLC